MPTPADPTPQSFTVRVQAGGHRLDALAQLLLWLADHRKAGAAPPDNVTVLADLKDAPRAKRPQ